MKIIGELLLGKGGQLGGREQPVSSGLLLSLGASQLGGKVSEASSSCNL